MQVAPAPAPAPALGVLGQWVDNEVEANPTTGKEFSASLHATLVCCLL